MFCLERAAKIVASLSGDAKIDTFVVFVEYFELTDAGLITDFARLCGFGIIEHVERA